MDTKITQYFSELDNKTPPGVKPMVVRQVHTWRHGPYKVIMETSCGGKRIAGTARISLYDSQLSPEPISVKRLHVSDWREAQDEWRRLVRLVGPYDSQLSNVLPALAARGQLGP